MSLSAYNGRYTQSFQGSMDIQDLKNRNKLLSQQNERLKQHIEELIQINQELTSSMQDFNESQNDAGPNINQQEIETLAYQVIELEKELQGERAARQQLEEQLEKARMNNSDRPDDNMESETIKVMQELATSLENMEQQHTENIKKLQQESDRKDQIIKDMQNRLHELSVENDRNGYAKESPQIASNIEELRSDLKRQIEQKQRVIEVYENLVHSLKVKITS